MAAQGHRRRAAMATAMAGGLALGLLVTGCAEQEPDGDGQDGTAGGGAEARWAVRTADAVHPGRAVEAMRRVAGALARTGGARVRTSMETESGGTRLTILGRGVYDFARPVGRLTVRVPQDARGTAEHRPITEVFTPGALYMKNRGAGVPPEKWVRLDTAALPDGDLLTSGATDPLAAAELLGGAREVTSMRDEGLDGMPVRHFWGTIDLAEAARRAPARDRAVLTAAARGFSAGTVAFDAFLDEEGLPRLLRYRFGVDEREEAADGSGAGKRTTVVSTVELSSFGFAPDIRLPESGDIYAGRVRSPRK
ncbi:hypothetical protein [Streptomyces caatingaensis]|uniref:Lipoprotein n=1 Tax=Streptomyces caatingaensis TaxID=1678637 RepID=A0A0K9XDD7_9ACTN|nr:hypothetical protein [Streptomyces caatingaensis]KNB51395.1 lipoprotein [Streptomyces caatingaensis]